MSHIDPMIMALRALGETAGTPQDEEHTQTCADCRRELAQLTEIVDLARHTRPGEDLEQPPPAVWDRIAAEVGSAANSAVSPATDSPAANSAVSPATDSPAANGAVSPAMDSPAANGAVSRAMDSPVSPAATGTTSPSAVTQRETPGAGNGHRETAPGPVQGTGAPGRRGVRAGGRRGRLVTALAGAAAGLIIGIGGTAGIVQLTRAPATRVVAQIELSPLPAFPQWQGATGTAVMRATAGQQVMVVTLHAPQRPGFYEVWLLARNGVSMISLGDLNSDHTGTFTVPPGVDLRNYSRIDVSLQPFNGSTLHSKTSVVRGSLPALALGAGSST